MEEISIYQIIFLIFFSGFISIDRLAGLNIMISRPIVISGIIGIVFGNIYSALMIGLIFEFIGMLEVPVGATVVHDDSFGGYVGSVIMMLGAVRYDAINILVAIFIISVLMYPVTLSDKGFREINRYFIKRSIAKNETIHEDRFIILGILLAFIRGVLVYNAGLIIIFIFMNIISSIELNFINMYAPVLALTIIATFMAGYLLRFLIINRLYKVLLLLLGMASGWWII